MIAGNAEIVRITKNAEHSEIAEVAIITLNVVINKTWDNFEVSENAQFFESAEVAEFNEIADETKIADI